MVAYQLVDLRTGLHLRMAVGDDCTYRKLVLILQELETCNQSCFLHVAAAMNFITLHQLDVNDTVRPQLHDSVRAVLGTVILHS